MPTASALRWTSNYFLAAQGLAGLHGFAAFFPAGAHGFAAFFLPAHGLAALALGAQGFVCWATAGSGAAASMPLTATIDPTVWRDFLRVVIVASSLLLLNIDAMCEPTNRVAQRSLAASRRRAPRAASQLRG